MKKIILPEIVAAGIYDAQIVYKNRMLTPNRKTTMYELELPLENGGISYIGKEKAEITKNLVICAKPGLTRHTRLPYKCYFVHMIIPEGDLIDHLSRLPNYIPLNNRDSIEPLFQVICDYNLAISPRKNILYASKLLELIYMLSSQYNHILLNQKNNSVAMNRVIQYIKDHLDLDLSLNVVAELADFSPSYFHSEFKNFTGKTLREFVEDQRIKKATGLLLSTNMTLTEIAYSCGFSSQSYFSYTFKRRMNMTPREYVNEHFKKYGI